jgi:uroporphyrinogen decarboxylase
VRHIIDKCAPGGRFALGSGNSIPSYVPLDHYLVMLDEALS